jgi:ACT domain-containing protein
MSLSTEEAIYQITRAVYKRLGEDADRKLVEELVTDIFNAIRPALLDGSQSLSTSLPSARLSSEKSIAQQPTQQRFIVSVFGVDRPGIVASVASLLAEANCNIADINQTVVQGNFAMIMIVDASHASRDVNQLRETFRNSGAKLGVRIYLQREDIFHAMHRV